MSYTTLRLDGSLAADIETAAQHLQAGDPVVFPTDTVYGVGTSPLSAVGIDKIYTAKIRPLDKGIPILLADIDDLDKVAADFPQLAWDLAEQYWPGALTLIVPKHGQLPANISPNQGIAVRVPDHVVGRELIRQAGGAVAATSANLSGHPPAQTATDAIEQLDGRVAAVVDGGPVPGGISSTIVSLLDGKVAVVRQGPIEIINRE